MGIIERKERDILEMREHIIQAAFDIILTEGSDHVTIRKIASRIEYSPASVYHYFLDRDQILLEVARISFQKFDEYFETFYQSATGNAWTKLLAAGKKYTEFAITNTNYYEVMFLIKIPTLQTRERSKSSPDFFGMKSFMMLKNLISECIEEGSLPEGLNVDLFTLSAWAYLHGLVSLHIRNRFVMVPEANVIETISLAFEEWANCIRKK